MGLKRILVMVAAALCAMFVAIYVRNSAQSTTVGGDVVVETTEVVEMPQTRVLVARTELRVGQRLAPSDLGWQPWPAQAIADAYILNDELPDAIEHYAGAVARGVILPGEPITGRKIVNPGEAGFMAAVLTPGMRAVSTRINAETGAGGFILPGDRVDVILTYDVEQTGPDTISQVHVSRTILEDVRVLAIDQTPQAEGEEQAYVGSTATLELIQKDAELLALAERLGDITLSLRSVVDFAPDDDLFETVVSRAKPDVDLNAGVGGELSIYRYGARAAVATGASQ